MAPVAWQRASSAHPPSDLVTIIIAERASRISFLLFRLLSSFDLRAGLVFSLSLVVTLTYNFAMAFMMPVIKNDYNIYPSCPSTRNGMGTPQSSRGSSLSSSPSGVSSSFMSSPRSSQTPAFLNTPKSGSETSLHRFHSKLLDKLRKTFRGKDTSDDSQASTSSTAAIR